MSQMLMPKLAPLYARDSLSIFAPKAEIVIIHSTFIRTSMKIEIDDAHGLFRAREG